MNESLRTTYLKAMGIELWRQRVPLPVVPGGEVISAPTGEPVTLTGAPAVSLALGVAEASPDLVALFDAADGELNAESERLLGDILRALGADCRKPAISITDWPAEEVGAAPGSSASIRETLRERVGDGPARVALLGTAVGGAIPDTEADLLPPGCRIAATHGLIEMRDEPGLKREAWERLQVLLQRGSADG